MSGMKKDVSFFGIITSNGIPDFTALSRQSLCLISCLRRSDPLELSYIIFLSFPSYNFELAYLIHPLYSSNSAYNCVSGFSFISKSSSTFYSFIFFSNASHLGLTWPVYSFTKWALILFGLRSNAYCLKSTKIFYWSALRSFSVTLFLLIV